MQEEKAGRIDIGILKRRGSGKGSESKISPKEKIVSVLCSDNRMVLLEAEGEFKGTSGNLSGCYGSFHFFSSPCRRKEKQIT